MLLDETQWSDHLCKNWEKAVIIFLPWPCMLIACEAKASEVISSLEWVRYECTGEHSSLRHSTVPSFHSILETRSLPAEENVMLLVVTNQLQKMEDYSIYSLSVLFTFNPLCLEFKKQKKTKQNPPGRTTPPFSIFLMRKPDSFSVHMAAKFPLFKAEKDAVSQEEPTCVTPWAPMDLCCCCTPGCTDCRLQGLGVDVTWIIKKICSVGWLQ